MKITDNGHYSVVQTEHDKKLEEMCAQVYDFCKAELLSMKEEVESERDDEVRIGSSIIATILRQIIVRSALEHDTLGPEEAIQGVELGFQHAMKHISSIPRKEAIN